MKHHHILRRGLCILLSLAMCLTMMPVTALAKESESAIISEATPEEGESYVPNDEESGDIVEGSEESDEKSEESDEKSEESEESDENDDPADSDGELIATSSVEGSESITICGTTPEEGKSYVPNAGDLGGIAERTEEADYLEYRDGVLTVHGNVILTQPADSADNVLKLEGEDLTINCPEDSSLTLNGGNLAASISLQSYALTLTGAGDVTIRGSETAVSGGTLKTEGYSGNLAISAEGNTATVSQTVLNLDTTGNISITGSLPVSEGLLTITNATDVTITGTAGNVLPEGSTITATGCVSIESTNNTVVNGLTVNNAQNVTLKGNTTDSVAINVTLNNCANWNIINENQEATAPLAVNITVDGTIYESYYGEQVSNTTPVVFADAAGDVAINTTNFPDDSFRAYIEANIDKDGDKSLSDEEIAACTYINVSYCDVKSLKGIEYFTKLYSFYCRNNQLTTIDVSKNTNLQYFECQNNQLTTIDVSKNTILIALCFDGNQLTTIDVSNNKYLGYMHCNDNQLTTINVSNNTRLYRLKCENNKLTTIDVSNNTALESLYCSGNNLTELNVSNNPELAILYCGENQLTELNFSNNPKLYDLSCHDNQLLSLDASGKSRLKALDISNNPKLTTLNCSNAVLDTLNISGNTALQELYCANNRLKVLDLSSYTALTTLDCQANMLTVLDLSHNKELTTLNCQGNWLTALDLSGTSVTEPSADNNTYVIDLDENRAFSLSNLPDDFDVTKASNWKGGKLNTEKTILTFNKGVDTITYSYDCGNSVTVTFTLKVDDSIIINETNFPDANFREKVKKYDKDEDNFLNYYEIHAITELDVSYSDILSLEGIEYFTNLTDLYCRGNTITTLDLSKNTTLNKLDCYNTGLTKLDLSNCTALETVDCSFNNLTTIVFKNNIKLKELNCYSNALSTVDLSSLTALETVKLTYNGLTTLDVSKNTALVYLECIGNNLTALDVSKNTALLELKTDGNQLKKLDVTQNTALKVFRCGENQLSTLDLSKNTELTSLSCDENPLKTLDVSNNTKLSYLNCMSDYLEELNVSKNTLLKTLYCYSNSLTALDLSQNSELTNLDVSYNCLTSLDLSNNSNIKSQNCQKNSFAITPDANRSFDLSTLPGNFDLSKASNWQGGTVNQKTKILTFDKDSEIVTYDYDTGLVTVTFTLSDNEIVYIDSNNFPDYNFRQVIEKIDYDKDQNSILTANEIAEIETLKVIWRKVESLKGVEYLTSLKYLDCQSNHLTTLDVSALTKLETLRCSSNSLTTLDLSNNTALKYLYCDSNDLTSLDISNCTALEELDCGRNDLTNLDVSNCSSLLHLECYLNEFTELDLSQNTALEKLECYNSNLTKLNVTNNLQLKDLRCFNNSLTTLDLTNNSELSVLNCSNNKLTKLDLSNNDSLTYIYCNENKLTKLDVSNCPNLKWILCHGNKLTKLDVSDLTNLIRLDCYNNNLTSLDIKNCQNLVGLYCYNNKLTSLSVHDLKSEATLNCSNNKLTSLDISNNYIFNSVNCSNNKLKELIVTDTRVHSLNCENNNLTTMPTLASCRELRCSNNKLTELNFEYWTWNYLQYIDCSNNNLTFFKCYIFAYSLKHIDCSNNNLTSIDLGNCPVEYLDCSNNNIYELDLLSDRDIAKLTTLNCSNNKLISLNISKCTALTTLDCSNNNLTALDFSKSKALTTLNCNNNNLSSLDLSMCTVLETLSCTGNVYTIYTDKNQSFEFSTLPGNFDASKASNWKGGTINEGQTFLTVNKAGTVTYDYDCGNSHSVAFTLKVMSGVAINSTNFPNNIFLAYVKTLDQDGNMKLSSAEITEVKEMDLSGLNINNFKGIEYFFALETLNISGNTSITTLNLLKSPALTTLDASGCKKLTSLMIPCDIVNLNISNTNLDYYDVNLYGQLKVLDVSGVQMPESLYLVPNVVSFKASGCGLKWFSSRYDYIETLDVSNNNLVKINMEYLTSLKDFKADGNTRNIGTIYNGEFSLHDIEVGRIYVLEVKGATLDMESGKFTNIEGSTVTYVYDTQNTTLEEAATVEFTLIIDRNMTVNYEVCTQKDKEGVYCETWEEVLAQMNNKNQDYYVYLYNDVKEDKLTFPSASKAKSITLLSKNEGEVKTITTDSTQVSIPIDASLENICMESTASTGLTISANKHLSLNEFSSKSLTLVKGSTATALEYKGSEDKIITADYSIVGVGSIELDGSIAFNNLVKANNLILKDASVVYAGADSVILTNITAKTQTAIRYNTKDFVPVTVNGKVTADELITIGVSDAVSDLKFSDNQTVLTAKSAELSMFKLDEGSLQNDSETGYTLGRVGTNIVVMKGVFVLSYSAGGTDYVTTFAKWSDVLNRIAYNAKLDKTTAKATSYKVEVLTDTNIGGALTMPKAGTFNSLWIKSKDNTKAKTLTFTGTTVTVTGTTTIDNLILNSVQKNKDKSVDFNFSAGKNTLSLSSVSGRIKDVKSSENVWLSDITINGNVSANEVIVLGTGTATISKTSVTINKNLTVKKTLTFSEEGSLTVKGAFSAGGLASKVSEDKLALVLYQNIKKPAVIGKLGFNNDWNRIKFALLDSEGNPVQLSDNTVIASISGPYANMLIPCDDNIGEFDCCIIKEKNKLVAKPKKDADGNAIKYFEVTINGKPAFYTSVDSAIKDINAVGKKTDKIEFIVTQEQFPNVIAKLPLPKAGKYETLTYTSEGGQPVTIQVKGDLALTGNLTIDSSVTINKMLEIKILKMTKITPISINVGKYEFHASRLSYDTTKSASQLKNVSGKGICSIEGDMIISGKVSVKTFDITGTVSLLNSASFASNIRATGDSPTLTYSLSNAKNVKLGNVTHVIENHITVLYVKIDGVKSGDKIATLTDDYIMDSVNIDYGNGLCAVRSKNSLVAIEHDKVVALHCLYDITRSYDSYESAVADITRLKNKTGDYYVTLPQGTYQWKKLALPAKGTYHSFEIEAYATSMIEVKSDITLTGNLSIGQNTTLRKVNPDGSVADVLNFFSPKDKKGQPVYTVTASLGKIINGRLNGKEI